MRRASYPGRRLVRAVRCLTLSRRSFTAPCFGPGRCVVRRLSNGSRDVTVVRSSRWSRPPATGRRPSCPSGPSATARPSPGCRSTKRTTIRRSCSPMSRRRSMRWSRSASGYSMPSLPRAAQCPARSSRGSARLSHRWPRPWRLSWTTCTRCITPNAGPRCPCWPIMCRAVPGWYSPAGPSRRCRSRGCAPRAGSWRSGRVTCRSPGRRRPCCCAMWISPWVTTTWRSCTGGPRGGRPGCTSRRSTSRRAAPLRARRFPLAAMTGW